LAEELLASYARVGGINHVDGKSLPSRDAVGRVTLDLLHLLFPGFFEDKVVHLPDLRRTAQARIERVLRQLERELRKSLEYAPPAGVEPRGLRPLAQQLAHGLVKCLPRLRDLLRTDVEAAYLGDPAALSQEEVIVAYPFVEAIAVQRLAHELYLQKVPLVPRMMTEWAHSRTGMDLHPGACIGPYFFVDHCTGTVVGETTVIGEHVRMYQGVGLVARSLSGGQSLRGQKRHPTIEDRVTIYAGATIMGGDTVVGAGSTIGANVFLTHSVPPRSLVVQEEVKARVTSKVRNAVIDFQI
jgi:serine O-acetyltransferase